MSAMTRASHRLLTYPCHPESASVKLANVVLVNKHTASSWNN